jgi:hypothetical protein
MAYSSKTQLILSDRYIHMVSRLSTCVAVNICIGKRKRFLISQEARTTKRKEKYHLHAPEGKGVRAKTHIILSTRLAVPFAPLTTSLQTQPVCRLPVDTPNPTKAAKLSTNTTLKDPQN